MAMIIADNRERAVIPHFQAYMAMVNKKLTKIKQVNLVEGQLTIGDYSIVLSIDTEKILMVIERKTWGDLADSIKTTRMSEQIKKMLAIRNNIQCKLLYIIEGKAFPRKTTKIHRIPFKNLHAKLRHILIRDNIPFIQSRNAVHTAEIIVDLALDFCKINKDDVLSPRCPICSNCIGGDEDINEINTQEKPEVQEKPEMQEQSETQEKPEMQEQEYKDDNNKDDEKNVIDNFSIPKVLTNVIVKSDYDIKINMWMAVPNVSAKSAPILEEKFNIADLICGNIHGDEIAELHYPSGSKFGETRAFNIMAMTNPKLKKCKKANVKILSAIPNITVNTAEKILEVYSLKEICSGKVTADQIAQIKKNPRRKIGPKAAKKIIDILIPEDNNN